MGLLPFHTDADRSSFPSVNLFNTPKLATIVVIDDVSSEALSRSPLSFLNTHQRTPLATTSLPANTPALLADMATGTLPDSHGIVGDTWRTQHGEIVSAYMPNRGESHSANIADILAQEWNGQSLIVTASASPFLYKSFAPHKQFNANAYPLVLGSNGFEIAQGFNQYSLSVSRSDVLEIIQSEAFLAFIGEPEGTIFNPETKEDMALLSELAFVFHLSQKLSTTFANEVRDNAPDLISIVFGSMKMIHMAYGKDSAQSISALFMIDNALSKFQAQVASLYGDNNHVSAIVVASRVKNVDEETKQKVYRAVQHVVYSKADFDFHYPAIFTSSHDDTLCQSVKTAASGTPVHCFAPEAPKPAPSSASSTPFSSPSFVTYTYTDYDPNTGGLVVTQAMYDQDAHIELFWIFIFLGLFLLVAILWGVYLMCYTGMDASKDSLLFRVAGRHLHQN